MGFLGMSVSISPISSPIPTFLPVVGLIVLVSVVSGTHCKLQRLSWRITEECTEARHRIPEFPSIFLSLLL